MTDDLRRELWGASVQIAATGLIILLVLALFIYAALAHDSWISKGGLSNPFTKKWCCGDNDCGPIVFDLIDGVRRPIARLEGYEVHGYVLINQDPKKRERIDEIVPYREVSPSPDGEYWYCRVMVMKVGPERRCFFAPPNGS